MDDTESAALSFNGCNDGDGNAVEHGSRFHPNSEDYCIQCLCMNGTRQMCLSASCGSPLCDNYERVPKTCCTYVCSSDPDSGEDALSAASIRMAITFAACIVTIVLAIFLVHKFRRHRCFLNLRRGVTRHSRDSDSSVSYTSGYDQVDAGLSYEPLHHSFAPPPYSPSSDILPPPYALIAENTAPQRNNQQAHCEGVGGVVNSGCQASPRDSMYGIVGYSAGSSSPPSDGATLNPANPGLYGQPVVRSSGVGGISDDETDQLDKKLSSLAVDVGSMPDVTNLSMNDSLHSVSISDSKKNSSSSKMPDSSSNQMRTESEDVTLSSKPISSTSQSNSTETSSSPSRNSCLPKRPEPIGGELTLSSSVKDAQSKLSESVTSRLLSASCTRKVRSADNSPVHTQGVNHRCDRRSVRLTQYGYIDSDRTLSDVDIGPIVGVSNDHLLEIAAKKPDRLNARVRRQTRIKHDHSSTKSS